LGLKFFKGFKSIIGITVLPDCNCRVYDQNTHYDKWFDEGGKSLFAVTETGEDE
jgi:hypothetical protein